METQSYEVYRGHIIHTPTPDQFEIIENGFIIVSDGKVVEVLSELSEKYQDHTINNFGNKLIIPGLNDMHIHAPQYPNRGLCLDESLMAWLVDCTLPLEAKFQDLEFARKMYAALIYDLWEVGNLRSLVYDTIYYKSSKMLLEMFIQSGLGAFVGKINMDINVPDYIKEDTEQSLIDTVTFIQDTKSRSRIVNPIIAPRFVPSCSRDLLRGLGEIAQIYDIPVMSHLSEDLDEMKFVKDMYPEFPTYGHIYNHFGLFGQKPTVMAHSIYSNQEERELIKANGVWIAHSPSSNFNLGSGMMPVRKFLDMGIKVGLGCDVAGGGDISLFAVMKDAISTSKIIWLYSGKTLPALKSHEAFYLATKGGGSFFGKVGSFEPGYDFDALVIDDTPMLEMDFSLEERIKRFIYLGNKRYIVSRYVAGRHIVPPSF